MSFYNYPSMQNAYSPSWPQGANPWDNQPRTNKLLVTSLDEAIAKSNERNSETVYFDQGRPVIYIVKVDMNGVKSWAHLDYSTGHQDTNAPATKADINQLTGKLEDLFNKLSGFTDSTKKKKKEVEVTVDESNG